jgi:serine/threonine protein kinase
MPFVACESLQQRLDRQGPLDVKDVLRIGLQAASGLAAAHAQGLVHRDVKPANILLETSVERVMLTDFGLARAVDDATLTRTGIIAGTPQYMSPEQANGDAVDPRSDLFSLGSVLYAMCTARPPFRADSTFGVLRRIRETPPRPIREINADIPEWLERIVMKLLSKSPDDRIASATQTATLLEQCLAHVQQPTTVALPVGVPIQRAIRSPVFANRTWRLASFIAVSLLIAGITTWAVWPRTKPAIDDGQKILVDQSLMDDSLLEWDNMQMKLDATASDVEQLKVEARQELEGLDESGNIELHSTKPHPPRGGG